MSTTIADPSVENGETVAVLERRWQQARDTLDEISQALEEHEAQLSDWESRQTRAAAAADRAHKALVDARARHQLGEGSSKDVEAAAKADRKAAEEHETAESTVALLTDRVRSLEGEWHHALETEHAALTTLHHRRIRDMSARFLATLQEAYVLARRVQRVNMDADDAGVKRPHDSVAAGIFDDIRWGGRLAGLIKELPELGYEVHPNIYEPMPGTSGWGGT